MTQEQEVRQSRKVPQEQALEAVRTRSTITVAVLAAAIGVSEQTARRAVESGDIRAVRLGRNWSVLTGPLREQFALDA